MDWRSEVSQQLGLPVVADVLEAVTTKPCCAQDKSPGTTKHGQARVLRDRLNDGGIGLGRAKGTACKSAADGLRQYRDNSNRHFRLAFSATNRGMAEVFAMEHQGWRARVPPDLSSRRRAPARSFVGRRQHVPLGFLSETPAGCVGIHPSLVASVDPFRTTRIRK